MNLGRGWIWYLAGLLLAVIAGVVAVLALRQAVPAAPQARAATRPVIVAKRDLTGRQILASDALETKDLALEDIPSGAVFRMEDATGKLLLQDVKAGQPLLAQNLTAASTGAGGVITSTAALAALLPTDKVAVVLPVTDLLGGSGELNIGDKIDLMGSMVVLGKDGTGGQVTLMDIQNVPIVKVLMSAPPSSGGQQQQQQQRPTVTGLVLAVAPQDGVIVKYFVDSGAKLSIDLRSPKLTAAFDMTPVTLEYLADKYKIQVPKPLPNR